MTESLVTEIAEKALKGRAISHGVGSVISENGFHLNTTSYKLLG
jgi:hypothetical protein